MIRKRVEQSANYSAVFVNGKTIRSPLDKTKPITELRYPEFLDVAINSKCFGGCQYCYTSATSKGINFPNVVERIKKYFGSQSLNEKVFQVALGGMGEPTLHPDFGKVLEAFHKLQIVPNYTTNCQHLTPEIINLTKKYCGGVAVTAHPHLEKFWKRGIKLLTENGIRTNIHVIISDKESIDKMDEIKIEFPEGIDYFVLLPYINVGFAAKNKKEIDYDYLEQWLDLHNFADIAFGANFYEFLKKTKKWDVSLYEPEIMSKYLVMNEDMYLYKSSFDTAKPVFDYHRETYLKI
jgi:sulfatase maturation enzyme AslB (radical SAM superfamily)